MSYGNPSNHKFLRKLEYASNKPESFKDYHISLLENETVNKDVVTDEDVRKAKEVFEKAKKQKLIDNKDYVSFSF